MTKEMEEFVLSFATTKDIPREEDMDLILGSPAAYPALLKVYKEGLAKSRYQRDTVLSAMGYAAGYDPEIQGEVLEILKSELKGCEHERRLLLLQAISFIGSKGARDFLEGVRNDSNEEEAIKDMVSLLLANNF